ncbi:MAG: hypothetical protein MUE81_00820 [Thermoflexibacter sp.]|jgi:hypothetical protein|nr:hypothetical protein [Thermoflexibacter sp.]
MRTIILSYFLFVYFISSIYAQTNPYEQLISHKLVRLLGKRLQDNEVQELIKQLGQRSELMSGNTIYAYPQKGVKLEFYAGKQLEVIELHSGVGINREEIFQAYSGDLPLRLSFKNNRRQVVTKLGKPSFFNNDYLQFNFEEITLLIYVDESGLSKLIIKRRTCISGDCQNGYGVFVSRTGERYEGNWKNGVRNGKGTCYYINGDIYEGEWVNNQLNGEGKMTYKNGIIKNGLWERDIFKGEIKSKEQLIYTLLGKHKTSSPVKLLTENYGGGFKETRLDQDYTNYIFNNSKLTLTFDEYGYLFKITLKNAGLQDFASSLPKGLPAFSDEKYIRYAFGSPKDVLKTESGNIFIYQESDYFMYVRFNQKSMLISVDFKASSSAFQYIFQKNYLDCKKGNCKSGYGELNHASNIYKGNFANSMFDGKGEMQYFSGGTYTGEFKQNKREGKGKYTWSDKSYYEGDWANNQREGKGTMVYANGDKYVGHWLRDLRSGEGTLYKANGKKITGLWELDELKSAFAFEK